MKIIKILFLIILTALILGFVSYNRTLNKPASDSGETREFIISSGDGAKRVSAKLADEGLISSRMFFEIYIWINDLEKKIQAGAYELSLDMNILKIVDIITSGKTVSNEKTIKLIEGWNNKDMAFYFEKEGLFSREEFLKEVGDKDKYASDFVFLQGIPAPFDMEGYLFPDTYQIFYDSSVEDVIRKLLANFDNKLDEKMMEDIEKQDRTLYETITLASLIEKEVRSLEDMKIVSGIFNNRLEVGQPLQSCATLAYILGENKPVYTIEDTRVDSLYNTYIHQGLPPGPIANPGFRAIEAAIYPTDTDYNYFLSASETGETIFSRTLEEHNSNKAKYLR